MANKRWGDLRISPWVHLRGFLGIVPGRFSCFSMQITANRVSKIALLPPG